MKKGSLVWMWYHARTSVSLADDLRYSIYPFLPGEFVYSLKISCNHRRMPGSTLKFHPEHYTTRPQMIDSHATILLA